MPQVVLGFHACGSNVGDNTQIPLPQWVLQVGACACACMYVCVSVCVCVRFYVS